MRKNKRVLRFVQAFAVCAACAGFSTPAYAYIGPAIAFVSYLFGPFIAVIAAIAMTVYLPVRLYLKKRKKKIQAQENAATAAPEAHDNAAEN